MPVLYDNNKIIPAPFPVFSQNFTTSNDGLQTAVPIWNITITGQLVAEKGSPNSTGGFWNNSGEPADEDIPLDSRLRSIINKQLALNKLFSTPNRLLEIQPFDGSAAFKAIISVAKLTFDKPENWVNYCNYVIDAVATRVWIGNNEQSIIPPSGLIPDQTWAVDLSDEKFNSYKLTHTVSSTQKGLYDETGKLLKPGWQLSKEIVTKEEGGKYIYLENPKASGLLEGPMGLKDHKAYNRVKSASTDENQGKYSFTENWLLYNPDITSNLGCLEDYTIDEKTDESQRKRVTIQGTLTGLEEKTETETITRISNADTYWDILRPQLPTIIGQVNPIPLSTSVGKNIKSGVITFSQDYDDRPIIFEGAVSAKVVVSDSQPADVFASLVVLGKANGPVLQSIGTITARKRSVSIDITMASKRYGGGIISKPNTDSLLDPYRPSDGKFKESDVDSWDEVSGKYTRTVSWTWVS